MPELTKTPRTSRVQIFFQNNKAMSFLVPNEKAKSLAQLLEDYAQPKEEETIPSEKVFAALDKKYGRSGVALQGARMKENFSQSALAKKIGISQADLSKMEHGKRPIGRQMAKRLAKVLKIDYRVFL